MTVAPGARTVAVVTPWYPTRLLPFRGAFVQAMVEATAPGCDRMTVIPRRPLVGQVSAADDESIGRAHRALLPQTTRTSTDGRWRRSDVPAGADARPRSASPPSRPARGDPAHRAGRPADRRRRGARPRRPLPSGWAVLDHLPARRPGCSSPSTPAFLDRLLTSRRHGPCTTRCCDRCDGILHRRRRHPGHPAQGAAAARRQGQPGAQPGLLRAAPPGAGHRVAPLAVRRRADPAQGGGPAASRRSPSAAPRTRR